MYEYASDAHAVTTSDLDTELARVANEYASRGWDLVSFQAMPSPQAGQTHLYTAFRKAAQSSGDAGDIEPLPLNAEPPAAAEGVSAP